MSGFTGALQQLEQGAVTAAQQDEQRQQADATFQGVVLEERGGQTMPLESHW